jgi:hypothetical protein
MTHITDSRGNHAAVGELLPAPSRKSMTVTEILDAGVRRRARHREMDVAHSAWDSEGGAAQRAVPSGGEGSPRVQRSDRRRG